MGQLRLTTTIQKLNHDTGSRWPPHPGMPQDDFLVLSKRIWMPFGPGGGPSKSRAAPKRAKLFNTGTFRHPEANLNFPSSSEATPKKQQKLEKSSPPDRVRRGLRSVMLYKSKKWQIPRMSHFRFYLGIDFRTENTCETYKNVSWAAPGMPRTHCDSFPVSILSRANLLNCS